MTRPVKRALLFALLAAVGFAAAVGGAFAWHYWQLTSGPRYQVPDNLIPEFTGPAPGGGPTTSTKK